MILYGVSRTSLTRRRDVVVRFALSTGKAREGERTVPPHLVAEQKQSHLSRKASNRVNRWKSKGTESA